MKKTIASDTVSLSAKDIRPLSVVLDRKALAEITGGLVLNSRGRNGPSVILGNA